MKSSHGRRLFNFVEVACLPMLALVASHCSSGGERPPIEVSDGDAGVAPTETGDLTYTGLQDGKDIFFGDSGFVNCGAQAGPKTFTIVNPTTDVVNFKVNLTDGATLYAVTPTEGGVPAKGSATVTVTPKAIPQDSDVVPDQYAGTIEITTFVGKEPKSIRLHQTARGAIINSTLTMNAIDFGSAKTQTTAEQQVSFTNSGNAEVTGTFQVGSQVFRVDGAQSGTSKLSPGGTVSKKITFSPVDPIDYTDSLSIAFNSAAAQCKTPPSTASLKGKGTTAVGVTPGTLNFGRVNCGSPAAAFQIFTVTSSVTTTYTPNFGKLAGSPFTLADNTGAAITPGVARNITGGTQEVLRVVPKAIVSPASVVDNAFGDKLTIASPLLPTPSEVNLTQTAQGAFLTFTPVAITRVNATAPNGLVSFTIENKGNFPVTFDVNTVGANFSSNITTNNSLAGGAAPLGGAVTFTGYTSGTLKIVAAAGSVLCADLPPTVPVSNTAL